MSQIRNTLGAQCPSVLSIAGSDSGGGAGIQADLKTFAALGVHGLSAIAALTAQNTRGVTAVQVTPVPMLSEQIRCLLDDFDVRAIKIGMLADAERIQCVAEALAPHPYIPVVLDPVMVASSGARLLAEDAVDAMRARLLPLATVLTPNLPEAEVLLGRPIGGAEDTPQAAASLLAAGPLWVLMKGGHLDEGADVCDRLFGRSAALHWSRRRLDLHAHGTGCTLSSALAALLAMGQDVPTATAGAIDFVHSALAGAYLPGKGPLWVLDHVRRTRVPSEPTGGLVRPSPTLDRIDT